VRPGPNTAGDCIGLWRQEVRVCFDSQTSRETGQPCQAVSHTPTLATRPGRPQGPGATRKTGGVLSPRAGRTSEQACGQSFSKKRARAWSTTRARERSLGGLRLPQRVKPGAANLFHVRPGSGPSAPSLWAWNFRYKPVTSEGTQLTDGDRIRQTPSPGPSLWRGEPGSASRYLRASPGQLLATTAAHRWVNRGGSRSTRSRLNCADPSRWPDDAMAPVSTVHG